ncbi:MAG: Maf family protein [Ignavibacteria bacterium]
MNVKKILSRKYVLASRSERRIRLLKQIGLNFIVYPSEIEEDEDNYSVPTKIIRRNSEAKAKEVSTRFHDEIIIAADTIVVLGNLILHKPSSLKRAKNYLKVLSGQTHIVYTGIYLVDTFTGKELFNYVKTAVKFRKLDTSEINYYVENFKPLDKAGAYGIQDDFGCLFIEEIRGDYYNVVGLPLSRLYIMLNEIVG